MRTLLTGATVISMDDERPNFEQPDVLVEDDRIVAVGRDLDGVDCERVDLEGRIVTTLRKPRVIAAVGRVILAMITVERVASVNYVTDARS
jgi:hypothetical protein